MSLYKLNGKLANPDQIRNRRLVYLFLRWRNPETVDHEEIAKDWGCSRATVQKFATRYGFYCPESVKSRPRKKRENPIDIKLNPYLEAAFPGRHLGKTLKSHTK